MDVLRVACVTPKNKDPVFATSVVWLIGYGYIPKMTDHQYQRGKRVLPVTWVKRDYCQTTEDWEAMGLTGYDARHEYCSMLMTMKAKTLHRIIDLIFKLTSDMFDMGRFPSRDSGPWEKLIRVQDLEVAIQQRFVAAKDSIELVLEASKKAIPDNIERLLNHETLMTNFLDMSERLTFSPKGSAGDKHLKAWLENMQKTGAKRSCPSITTAANVNESMRILLRERAQNGIKLTLSVVLDPVRAP